MDAKEFIRSSEGKMHYEYLSMNTVRFEWLMQLTERYAKMKQIEENKSILSMAEIHMDERAVLVIKQRIFDLEQSM